jgi:hypothetical protein
LNINTKTKGFMMKAGHFKWLAAMVAVTVMVIASAAFAQDLPRTAVYVTGDLGENEKKALGTKILVYLVNSGRYKSAERAALFLAEADRERQTRGAAIDDGQISELGKRLDINFVCVVDVTPVFGEFQISARMVNVETAGIELIGAAASPLKSLSDLEQTSESVVKNMFGAQAAPVAEPDPAAQAAAAPPLADNPALPPTEISPPLPRGPIKAAVYVTGIPPMVAKPFNSAISEALIKSRIYAGIESIDVSGAPSVPALAAAGRNAGVSYIFAINVAGQISVAIIDVAGTMELAKITIDGKITAVSAVVIAKKIVDFILTSGPKPDPDMQVVEETAPVQPVYKTKTKNVWSKFEEPDSKSRRLENRINVEIGGAFSPYTYYSYRDWYNISGESSSLGGGGYIDIDLIYAEILLNVITFSTSEIAIGGLVAKYPIVLGFVKVSPLLGLGGIHYGGLMFGGRVDVGISEIAYLRSEYLYVVDDGSSFKIGGGLDIGLGERKRIYLRPELLYSLVFWSGGSVFREERETWHSIDMRLGIGYKWGGVARKEYQAEVKPKDESKKWLSAGSGGFGGGYSAGWYMFFDATYAEAYFGVLGGGVTTGAFAKLPFGSDVVKFFPLAGFDYNGWANNAFGVLGAGVDVNVYQDVYVRSEFMYNLGKLSFATFRGGAGYRF